MTWLVAYMAVSKDLLSTCCVLTALEAYHYRGCKMLYKLCFDNRAVVVCIGDLDLASPKAPSSDGVTCILHTYV